MQENSGKFPEDLSKEYEAQVNHLLEASALALRRNDLSGALERAKEANRQEKALYRHREKHGHVDEVKEQTVCCIST